MCVVSFPSAAFAYQVQPSFAKCSLHLPSAALIYQVQPPFAVTSVSPLWIRSGYVGQMTGHKSLLATTSIQHMSRRRLRPCAACPDLADVARGVKTLLHRHDTEIPTRSGSARSEPLQALADISHTGQTMQSPILRTSHTHWLTLAGCCLCTLCRHRAGQGWRCAHPGGVRRSDTRGPGADGALPDVFDAGEGAEPARPLD